MPTSRAPWAALALALILALVAALAATRTRVAFEGWRVIALSAPLVAIGAARALDGGCQGIGVFNQVHGITFSR